MQVHENTVVSVFTQETVSRLTGLSERQLSAWDRTGFFSPSLAHENRRKLFSRVYSFQDILSLQVLKTLRIDLRVSLQHLRQVKEKLSLLGEGEWARTKLYVVKGKVVFHDKKVDAKRDIEGQYIVDIPLEVVRKDMQKEVDKLKERPLEKIGQFEKKRYLVHNSEVIAGTRIRTSTIQEFILADYSDQSILEEFPSLTLKDIEAVRRKTDIAA